MDIRNRTVVVTGGTSGLGLACAKLFAREGARVAVIAADREGVERLRAEGFAAWQCDVSEADALLSVFKQIHQDMGLVSVLVNCAGIAITGNVIRNGRPVELDEFRHVIRVNLLGTINAIRCAAAHMMESHAMDPHIEEHGVIINTSSIASTDGQVGQAAYAASKGGVSSMVLPLARELGDFGVRVNGVAPGVFETPMTLSLPAKSRDVVFAAKPPSPPRAGRAAEFADLVLAMVRNTFINGTVVRLDGGLRMPAKY